MKIGSIQTQLDGPIPWDAALRNFFHSVRAKIHLGSFCVLTFGTEWSQRDIESI